MRSREREKKLRGLSSAFKVGVSPSVYLSCSPTDVRAFGKSFVDYTTVWGFVVCLFFSVLEVVWEFSTR